MLGAPVGIEQDTYRLVAAETINLGEQRRATFLTAAIDGQHSIRAFCDDHIAARTTDQGQIVAQRNSGKRRLSLALHRHVQQQGACTQHLQYLSSFEHIPALPACLHLM